MAVGHGRLIHGIKTRGKMQRRAQKGSGKKVRDWTATRTETRYGCFLPDLTGLARSPSTASLSRTTIPEEGASHASVGNRQIYLWIQRPECPVLPGFCSCKTPLEASKVALEAHRTAHEMTTPCSSLYKGGYESHTPTQFPAHARCPVYFRRLGPQDRNPQ